MTVSVVPWDADLLAAAVELYVEVFNAEPWNDRWTPASAARRLADLQATPGFAGAALLDDATMIAFIAGYRQRWWDDSDHFYLAEFAVRGAAQRSGHGTRLLESFLAGLDGVTTCYLLTAGGGPAAAFYRRAGFGPAGRQLVFTRKREGRGFVGVGP